jgi:predicted DNA-binding antitoxin AbrB/MazE fold protein
MINLRLRYENGIFIPLEPVATLQEGQEVFLQLPSPVTSPERLLAIQTMLEQSRGAWAGPEWDGIEEELHTLRQTWDAQWQYHLNSL